MAVSKFKAKIVNNAVVIDDPSIMGELYDSGYGMMINKKLKLEPFEALYLIEKGRMILTDSEQELTFDESIERLSRIDKKLWIKYTIYSDLRNKGYVVKSGFSQDEIEFRVYDKNAKPGKEPAKYLLRVLIEGEPVSIEKLMNMVKSARDSRKDLIIAVIDAQGDVAYYEVSEVHV